MFYFCIPLLQSTHYISIQQEAYTWMEEEEKTCSTSVKLNFNVKQCASENSDLWDLVNDLTCSRCCEIQVQDMWTFFTPSGAYALLLVGHSSFSYLTSRYPSQWHFLFMRAHILLTLSLSSTQAYIFMTFYVINKYNFFLHHTNVPLKNHHMLLATKLS